MNSLIKSLESRGYSLESFEDGLITIAKKGKKEHLFIGGYTPLVPYNIGLILSNKSFMKEIVRDAHVAVPEGKTFAPDRVHEAMVYVQSLRFPVVLKQENSQKNIRSLYPIKDLQHFRSSFANLAKEGESVIVETYCPGPVFHVYFDSDGCINILETKQGTSFIAMSDVQEKNTRPYDVDVTNLYGKKFISIARKVLHAFPPMPYICFSVVHSGEVLEVYHSANRHMDFFAHKGNKQQKVSERLIEYLLL